MSRLTLLVVATAVLTNVVAVAVLYLVRDLNPKFAARRSAIAAVYEQSSWVADGSRFQSIRLVATSGLTVELTTRRALSDGARRLPVVVILGGHLTGAEAAKLVGQPPGLMIAAMSYPFTGDPRPSAITFLQEIPKIRAAFHDTPPALMLTLDYLLARADADSTQVESIGVSLGAPFVTIAGALDQRFTRVWALHGSGGSYAPLEASMRRTIKFAPLRAAAAAVANVIIAGPRLAAEGWVARIAPRPFMMVNATDDERLPRSAVDRLFESAAQPKEIIWMSGAHVHGDAPTIQRLVEIVMARVSAGPSSRK